VRADQWLLFGHLIGVLLLFGAIALENVTLFFMLRSRTVEELRAATTFARLLGRMFPIAVVLILGFGIGLVGHSDEFKWGEAWIDLGLGLLILLTIVGPTVQGRRVEHIYDEARAAQPGRLTAELSNKVRDPIMRAGMVISTWLAIGIVLLMTRQPDWAGAWLTVAVFALVGIGETMMLSRVGAPTADAPELR
jgi:uncharacterized membrane protein